MNKPERYKLVLVNTETGERKDSYVKGSGILSRSEANFWLKQGKKLLKPWIWEKVRTQ